MADVPVDAPVDAHNYSLSSKYLASQGDVFLTGVQALARIPIEQLRRDRQAGLNTAAFVSGYPGSPLGGFDLEMTRALALVANDLPITHVPAVNEELGATAVMGSQLVSARDDARYDGVVGLWYGKAPGLDRATDALRHGVFAGSSPLGGALALVGDDPAAKSSTMPSSSDAALADLHMPVLYPANTAECLELGLHGIEMSRATGLWSALKVVTAVADGSGTIRLPVPHVPATVHDGGAQWTRKPSAQFLGPRMVEVERDFHEIRTGLALQYGRDNRLNRFETDPRDAWLGIVATGFTFGEVVECFRRLGMPSMRDIESAGVRLLNLRMPLPFDPELIAQLAIGLDQLLVVEEKNPTLETLVRSALYDTASRPTVHGKMNTDAAAPLPSYGRLDADAIMPVLRAHLEPRLADSLPPPPPPRRERIALSVERVPFFCSGCPHNWGTKVPEGAVVGMGTGCHGMTLLMDEDRVGDSIGITAMGNEGAQWIGMAPFVETQHVFQNFGDGTFLHSGQLALQAAIGAGANVTFKILYNHTVAMTGGQDASHMVGPGELAAILQLHGAKEVVITTDDLSSYKDRAVPPGVSVHDRSELIAIQERLANVDGVTVIIHDQGCAAELRRDRKRGRIEQPTTRVVINHRICEGCGDCGDVSSCLSVQPVETPFGRKTQIDQHSCNFDYSCMLGDCPAFMTVQAHEEQVERALPRLDDYPAETPVRTTRLRTALRLAGIGGTGVVTIAQILATAATLDGLAVAGLDQTGLSQKAGPVISDVVLYDSHESPRSNLPGNGQADVMLALDLLVGASDRSVHALHADSKVFASTTMTPTGPQITTPSLTSATPGDLKKRITASTGAEVPFSVDSSAAATVLTGRPATANVLVLGAAAQSGELPVSIDALHRAIELNGVAVQANLLAFEWGRRIYAHPTQLSALVADRQPVALHVTATALPNALRDRIVRLGFDEPLAETVRLRAADLVDYQHEQYAHRYVELVETAWSTGHAEFTTAVATSFHKLMAYKDEYEVARLMLHPDGLATADEVGTDRAWHLHPPTLKALGRAGKIRFGARSAPLFRALAAAKRVRGTWLDPFARTEMRRLERELVDDYESAIRIVTARLAANPANSNAATAVEIAELPDMIRGFEELKLRRVDAYRIRHRELMDQLTKD